MPGTASVSKSIIHTQADRGKNPSIGSPFIGANMSKNLSPQYRNYIRSDRWLKGWRRQLTLRLLLGGCVLLPFLRATQADHLTYKNLEHELPIRDLVPVHPASHAVIGLIRDIARAVLGRKLGNAIVAWWLRFMLLAWWGCAVLGVLAIAQFAGLLP